MNNGQVRSRLFSYWAGQLKPHERVQIRLAIETVRDRMPHAHRALIEAHVDGRRDVDWREEAQAVDAIRSLLLNTPSRRKGSVDRRNV